MSGGPNLAQRLSDAIAAGSYRPGEWLKQIDLATSFGVTRFEIRKALEELTLRKAVVHIPEKGYRVGEPSATDISEARSVRVILETEATKLVVGRIDDSGIALLERLSSDFWHAVEEGTPAQRNHANHLFHDTMYAFSGNTMLVDLIRETRDRARGSPIYLWYSVRSMRESAENHDEIIAQLKARNAAGAVDAVRRHILKNSA